MFLEEERENCKVRKDPIFQPSWTLVFPRNPLQMFMDHQDHPVAAVHMEVGFCKEQAFSCFRLHYKGGG